MAVVDFAPASQNREGDLLAGFPVFAKFLDEVHAVFVAIEQDRRQADAVAFLAFELLRDFPQKPAVFIRSNQSAAGLCFAHGVVVPVALAVLQITHDELLVAAVSARTWNRYK